MFDLVRLRLTLWYAGVLALSLVAFALVIYYAAARSFHERQDESLRSTAQTVASAYVEEIGEAHSLTKAAEVVLVELTFPNRYVQILDSNAHPTAASKNLSGTVLTIPPGTAGFVTVNGMRVAVVPVSTDRAIGYAAVAEPLSVLEEGLGQLRRG